MTLGAKAWALIKRRVTPSFQDVKFISRLVLRHRLIPNFNAEADGVSIERIIDDITSNTPMPT